MDWIHHWENFLQTALEIGDASQFEDSRGGLFLQVSQELVPSIRPLLSLSHPFKHGDWCEMKRSRYPPQPRQMRTLHETTQTADSPPNVQIRAGTGRLHCVEYSLLDGNTSWRREDILTCNDSVPKIKIHFNYLNLSGFLKKKKKTPPYLKSLAISYCILF